MKIWIVNPFDNLSAEGYRPQRYELLAKAFTDRGEFVQYWTSDFSHATKSPRRLQESFFRPAFEIKMISTLPYTRNLSYLRFKSHRQFAETFLETAEREIAERGAPQMMIVSLPPLTLSSVALKLGKRYGIKVIVDVQDLWPHNFSRLLPRGCRWMGRILFARQYLQFRAAMKGAEIVTGVADSYKRIVMASGARNYLRYYLGFPMGRAATEKRDNMATRRLAYAGGLGRTYDLRTVIRALSQLDRWTLEIFGTGEYENELRRVAVECGIGDRVTWHGYVTADKLRSELAGCSAGVVPMDADSCVALPNKLGDYVDASIPIISSLTGESFELLSRYGAVSGYKAGDVKSFVMAVKRISELVPDFDALRRQLDAQGIYNDFAAKLLSVMKLSPAL